MQQRRQRQRETGRRQAGRLRRPATTHKAHDGHLQVAGSQLHALHGCERLRPLCVGSDGLQRPVQTLTATLRSQCARRSRRWLNECGPPPPLPPPQRGQRQAQHRVLGGCSADPLDMQAACTPDRTAAQLLDSAGHIPCSEHGATCIRWHAAQQVKRGGRLAGRRKGAAAAYVRGFTRSRGVGFQRRVHAARLCAAPALGRSVNCGCGRTPGRARGAAQRGGPALTGAG